MPVQHIRVAGHPGKDRKARDQRVCGAEVKG